VLLSVQSAVAVNPLRALFGSKSNTPLLHNDPAAIVSTDGRVNVRNPRILQVADGQDFVTLTCNTNIDWNSVPCVPWPFGESAENVVVECNQCFTMENYNNTSTSIDLSGTLNIKGKLDFPDGTKVTLNTAGIIVQGELSIQSSKVVDGVPDITIRFTGTDDVFFNPEAPNTDVCGTGNLPCNLGPKPFVVAGGTVDIKGLPDDCPTWTTMLDIISDDKHVPLAFAQPPELPTTSEGVCSDEFVITEDFESGINKWYGNVGAEESLVKYDDSSSSTAGSYLHIAKRTHAYQGPMLDLPPLARECLLTDQDYLFSAKIRISPGSEFQGVNSLCHETGSDSCPMLQFSHMDASNSVRWRELVTTDDIGVQDNEWFVIHKAFTLQSKYLPINSEDVYSLFTINGVEPGVDIDIDDVSITLPPAEAYPDPTDVCSNLVVNGNAENLGLFSYPVRPYIGKSTVTVQEEGGNSYFSITNRKQIYDSVAIDINPECLQTSSVYNFSAKIRLHAGANNNVQVKLVSTVPGKQGFEFDIGATALCDVTSSGDTLEWVTCESKFVIKQHLSTASQVQLLIMFATNQFDTADFDDISFTFEDAVQEGGIELKDDLSSCYAPGAKVLIPSDDLAFNSEQIVTLEKMLSGNIVAIEEDIVRVSTYANDPNFPTEFAVLSRNILFTSDDGVENAGPSFVVLNTPYSQKISGVDFTGFGRASTIGQLHPINFISSSGVSTFVSKNTIQRSNNGCINLVDAQGTHIIENVAYDTKGDCFKLSSGVNNLFDRNLGAVTRVGSGTDCATFSIGHPTNTFTGNVAAGSERIGFDFLQHESDVVSFTDNVSHSNSFIGVRSILRPLTVNTWTNIKVYRNLAIGILFHQSQNILLDGGMIADNRIGIDVWTADSITISGMKVIGSSEPFRKIAEVVPSTEIHCSSAAASPVYGVRIHPNAWITDVEGGGTKIENVSFSDFTESTGCNPLSTAIVFNTLSVSPSTYTTNTQVIGLTFDTSSTSTDEISLCDAFTAELYDIYVTDDGSLNPYNDEPGIVISNNSTVTDPGSCLPMVGSCAQYCIPSGGSGVATVPGSEPANAGAGATTPGSAPANAGAGATVPGSEPTVTPSDCILNGDMSDNFEHWQASMSNLELVIGAGDSGYALEASGRTHQMRAGPSQKINPTCLTEGYWHEITMDVKMTNSGDNSIFDCDPTDMYIDPDNCAGVHAIVGTTLMTIAHTVAPLRNDGWNKIYGTFKATSQMMAQSSIELIVSRAPTHVDIAIDNVVISRGGLGTECSQPLSNGNAESGDARGWYFRGHGDGSYLEMGYPGYNDSGNAFKHKGTRGNKLYSMVQKMDNSCFGLGSTWTITAQFRLFDATGQFQSCNRNTVNDEDSCLVFSFMPGGKVGLSTGALANLDLSQVEVDGSWNRVMNEFTVTSDTQASDLEMWVNIDVPTQFYYEIDDIQLVQVA